MQTEVLVNVMDCCSICVEELELVLRIILLEFVDPVIVELPGSQTVRASGEEEEHDYCFCLHIGWLS